MSFDNIIVSGDLTSVKALGRYEQIRFWDAVLRNPSTLDWVDLAVDNGYVALAWAKAYVKGDLSLMQRILERGKCAQCGKAYHSYQASKWILEDPRFAGSDTDWFRRVGLLNRGC